MITMGQNVTNHYYFPRFNNFRMILIIYDRFLWGIKFGMNGTNLDSIVGSISIILHPSFESRILYPTPHPVSIIGIYLFETPFLSPFSKGGSSA
jgi:hypothetical protein